MGKREINLSRLFAGQYVGVAEVENNTWLVSYMDYDLGFFAKEVNPVEPAGENPFAPKVLPMPPEWTVPGENRLLVPFAAAGPRNSERCNPYRFSLGLAPALDSLLDARETIEPVFN